MSPTLFDPISFGAIQAKNRILMAPLTRGRAEADGVPGDLMVEYYRQRAGAGMIVSEATAISPQGFGWSGAPGVWTDEQIAGWRRVTDAVHAAGGAMALQLWHMGRLSHPDYQPGGQLPVAPSAIAAPGKTRDGSGERDYVTPRALLEEELPELIQDYARAAKQAIDAGFDGVEIHGANGYLLDEFLRDGSNHRSDRYGGPVENRARLMLEVTDAVCTAIGSDRTGLRLSPRNANGGISDSDPVATFSYVAEKLNGFDLAFVHLHDALPGSPSAQPGEFVTPHIRAAYHGNLIGNGGYKQESATQAISNGEVDAVAFGVPFLTNPDLPERFRQHAALNKPNPKTFYSAGPEGYVDYPTLGAAEAA